MNLILGKSLINNDKYAFTSPKPLKTMSGFLFLICCKIGFREFLILGVLMSIISTSSFKKSRYKPSFLSNRIPGENFCLGK